VTSSIQISGVDAPALDVVRSTPVMADKAQVLDPKAASDGAAAAGPPVPPKRSPGHRGADVRDTVAEMAAKAQEISLEAGSKMAAAMKDVISAAAGLSGFAIESARDLVQYMVRRGQMTQDEADKLIREAETSDSGRKPHPVPPPSRVPKPPPPPRPDVGHIVVSGPPTLQRPMAQVAAAPPPRAIEAAPVKHAAGPAKKTAPKAKKKAKPPVAKKKVASKGGSKKKSGSKR
jgi:polyhydroxyalkanoate synthesis regulator phasin